MTDTSAPTTAPVNACKACPWRLANQGTRHPDGWYTKANLRRLWAGLRRGKDMSCHPTDPNNLISDKAQQQGYRPAPEHADIRECVGSVVIKQREAVLLQREHGNDITAYRTARPRGLTRVGIAALVQRVMFAGTILGGPPMPRPDLNDTDIGYPPLGTWTPLNPTEDNTQDDQPSQTQPSTNIAATGTTTAEQ